MFFEGDPLNEQDRVLQAVRFNRQGLFAKQVAATKGIDPDALVLLMTWLCFVGES